MRRFIFVMALLIGWLIPAKGQQLALKTNRSLYSVNPGSLYKWPPDHLETYPIKHITDDPPRLSFLPVYSETTAISKPSMIAPDFYYTHCYGFFCKLEWMTQDQWHFPLSIRLGSYSYERGLEGEQP